MYFLFNTTTLQVFVTCLTGALWKFLDPSVQLYTPISSVLCDTHEIGVCSCTDGSRNSQRTYVRYVTKPWSVVLLNKKKTYSSLKYIVYGKWLKPRQSFWITLYKMCFLIFSTAFVWNISHSEKNWVRYDKKKCMLVFMWSTVRYSCQIVKETEVSEQIFEKNKKTHDKFHENPSSGSQVQCRRTDRHAGASSRFSRFRERS